MSGQDVAEGPADDKKPGLYGTEDDGYREDCLQARVLQRDARTQSHGKAVSAE